MRCKIKQSKSKQNQAIKVWHRTTQYKQVQLTSQDQIVLNIAEQFIDIHVHNHHTSIY